MTMRRRRGARCSYESGSRCDDGEIASRRYLERDNGDQLRKTREIARIVRQQLMDAIHLHCGYNICVVNLAAAGWYCVKQYEQPVGTVGTVVGHIERAQKVAHPGKRGRHWHWRRKPLRSRDGRQI